MTETRLIPGVLSEDIDNRKESAESLSSILFEWIYNQVKEKVPFLQYYKEPDSHKLKRSDGQKQKATTTTTTSTTTTGPERVLSPENELLLTLMKLRLSFNSQFLGHLS